MTTFDERLSLMRLMIELRQLQPWGIVGVLETRNMFANLFDEFAAVRDSELDELVERMAEAMRAEDEALAEKLDDFDSEEYMNQEELDS